MTTVTVNRRELGTLMLNAAIRSTYDDYDGDHTEYRPCMAMVATSENLAGIAVQPDHEFAREIEVGTLIVVEPNQAPVAWPIGQHENSDVVVPLIVPAEGANVLLHFSPFRAIEHERLISSLMAARRAAGENAEQLEGTAPDGDMLANAGAWIGMMSDHFADMRARLEEDPDSVPGHLRTQALIAGLTERYGEADFPNGLTPADLARYTQADAIRAEITKLAPDHPDALPAERSMSDILSADFGIEDGSAGRGSAARWPTYTQSDEILRMVRSNDRLCREVFGAMTSTPIEHLQCGRVSPDTVQLIKARMGEAGARIEADWCQAVNATLNDIFSQTMRGYQYETAYFSAGGRDILTVQDHQGGYVYSWPSEDRRPVMEIGNRLVAGIAADAVPSQEDIARLSDVLSTLQARQLARQNDGPDFGM